MSMLWHCPICWDGEETCKCTENEYKVFYDELKKEKEKRWEDQRKQYHKMLDESFDRYKKLNFEFDYGIYPSYLAQEFLKLITKEEWKSIKIKLDKFYNRYHKK